MTPTPTPTVTVTPTTTSGFCGIGVTLISYYYYDCCGNYIVGREAGQVVVLDYGKPFARIIKLNRSAPVICSTPSPTPTSTVTPSFTNTPTVSPTLTQTPTQTPTNTPYPEVTQIYALQNECEVFTVFDMAIQCYTVSYPSTNSSFDGELKILVTGGTAPFQYVWDAGQNTQSISGIKSGTYGVTVVDFYGDYTASTICSLVALTPTPTITPTMTQTPSPTTPCTELCLIAIPDELTIGGVSSYGPWQFVCNGRYNNRQVWTYNSEYNIVWNIDKNRWEVVENDFVTPVFFNNGNIMSSLSTQLIPLNQWTFLGVSQRYTFNVTQGACPPSLPLNVSCTAKNTKCAGFRNCSGSIIFTPVGGVAPYMYSINNGLTYSTSNVFNSICEGTYVTKTKDSTNLVITKTVTVGTSQTPVTYNVSVVSIGTQIIEGTNASSQFSNFEIQVNPPLPIGTSITLNLNLDYRVTNMGPWFNNDPDQTATHEVIPFIFKNGVNVTNSLITGSTSSELVNRSFCNPSQNEITTGTFNTTINIGHGDTITGYTYSELIEVNPTELNGCVSSIENSITIYTSSLVINGCYCCYVGTLGRPLIFDQSLEGTPLLI